jgi:hypothetical protein
MVFLLLDFLGALTKAQKFVLKIESMILKLDKPLKLIILEEPLLTEEESLVVCDIQFQADI